MRQTYNVRKPCTVHMYIHEGNTPGHKHKPYPPRPNFFSTRLKTSILEKNAKYSHPTRYCCIEVATPTPEEEK